MLGNVWEWVQDGPRTYSSGAQVDPVGPPSGNKVRRGGSWNFGVRYARVSYRNYLAPTFRDYFMGFRVLREAIP